MALSFDAIPPVPSYSCLKEPKMKIDTKARWAIAAILDIAIHGTDHPVRLADISKRQRVSQSHLEHLFRRLRESGFVASVRGPGGGYRLIRRLATISVADVIASVDTHAFGSDPCHDTNRCAEDHGNVVDGVWCRLDDHLRNYLRTVNMASVLAGATEAADLRERMVVVATIPYVEMAAIRHEDRSASTTT
jgi:Rrf2 family transcriptional regulator, iron-sulfur cluster assembly transcription factor